MKKYQLLIFLLAGISALNAQNDKVFEAFKDSYTFESAYEYEKASLSLERIYSEYATNYEINLRLGWLHYLSGDFKNSEKYYDKALKIRPLSLEAVFGKILPLTSEGRYDEIISAANKVLEVSPGNAKAEYYLGMAYYYKKDYLRSEKYLEKAINKYPFDLDINLMLGWTKFALGKKNEAVSLFQVARRNSPNNYRVLAALKAVKK